MPQAHDLMEIRDFRGFFMVLEQYIAATTWVLARRHHRRTWLEEMFALQITYVNSTFPEDSEDRT